MYTNLQLQTVKLGGAQQLESKTFHLTSHTFNTTARATNRCIPFVLPRFHQLCCIRSRGAFIGLSSRWEHQRGTVIS